MSSEVELARFVNRTRYEDLPEEVVKATKREVFDTIGVGLSGSSAPGIGEVVDYVRETGGRESSTVLAYGFKVPPANAALANGGMCHARDFDDTHDIAIIHTGSVVMPAAFAVAEQIGRVSGKELINAITLGIDIHCRLGLATKSLLGWALPALYGYFAAAAAAGKLLGLDEDSLLNAWGIAYSQAAGNLGMIPEGGLNKRLQLGFASSGGVFAALLAQKGITGSKHSFEGPMGVFNLYQRGKYDPAELTVALGKEYRVTDFSFKPYPCCRGVHGGIDAALEIARKYDIQPDQIEEVIVGMVSHDYEVCCEPTEVKKQPRNIVDAQFSLPYTVACALVRNKVDLEDFTEDAIKDPAVLKLASRVKPSIDPEIEKGPGIGIAAARMEVRTKTGDVYSTEVNFSKGHPKNQMTDAEFEAKFRSCALSGIKNVSPEEVDNLIEILSNLEQVDDIRQVTKLFHLRK